MTIFFVFGAACDTTLLPNTLVNISAPAIAHAAFLMMFFFILQPPFQGTPGSAAQICC